MGVLLSKKVRKEPLCIIATALSLILQPLLNVAIVAALSPGLISVDPSENPSHRSKGGTLNYDATLAAFLSTSGNLDPNYNFPTNTLNEYKYLYVRDLQQGVNKLVSIGTDGQPYNHGVTREGVRLSRDGSKLFFRSRSTNIVTAQLPQGYYLYARDLATGQVQLVGEDELGQPLYMRYYAPAADGNIVAYSIGFPTDPIYVKNLVTQQTTRLPINGIVNGMSSDGRYITYQANVDTVIHRYDRQTSQDIVISLAENGEAVSAFGSLFARGMSSDGNRIVFTSQADILSGHPASCQTSQGGTRRLNRVYIRDVNLGQTMIADVASGGQEAAYCNSAGIVEGFYIDDSGNRVAFGGYSALDSRCSGGSQLSVFVHDFSQNTTKNVTCKTLGEGVGYAEFYESDISGDGGTVTLSARTQSTEYQAYVISAEGYIDTVPPIASFSEPDYQFIAYPEGYVVRSQGYTIQGGAYDEFEGIKEVRLAASTTTLTSAPGGGISLACTDTSRHNCSWIVDSSKLPPGVNTYTLTVIDNVGNISTVTKVHTVI